LHGEVGHRETYQVALARAVGALPDVVALAEPLLTPGGRLVVQLGRRRPPLLAENGRDLMPSGLTAQRRVAPALDPRMAPTELLVIEKLAGRRAP
jgi:16S rRNA G527 N7-methylase RsmG